MAEEKSTFKTQKDALIYKILNDELKVSDENFNHLVNALIKEEDIDDVLPTLIEKLKPYLNHWTELYLNASDYDLLENYPLELFIPTANSDEILLIEYLKSSHSSILGMIAAYKLQNRLLSFLISKNEDNNNKIQQLKFRLKKKGIKDVDEETTKQQTKKNFDYEELLMSRENG